MLLFGCPRVDSNHHAHTGTGPQPAAYTIPPRGHLTTDLRSTSYTDHSYLSTVSRKIGGDAEKWPAAISQHPHQLFSKLLFLLLAIVSVAAQETTTAARVYFNGLWITSWQAHATPG